MLIVWRAKFRMNFSFCILKGVQNLVKVPGHCKVIPHSMTLVKEKVSEETENTVNTKIMTQEQRYILPLHRKPIFTKNFSTYSVRKTTILLHPIHFNNDIISLNKGFETQMNENNQFTHSSH